MESRAKLPKIEIERTIDRLSVERKSLFLRRLYRGVG
jgi:hypothetical protein